MKRLTLAAGLAAANLVTFAHAAGTCQAASGAVAPTVVELYTSEGCSSCPPADRWLSTLKGRPDVLALSFHVTYWDKLGWPDRYASPEATARQYAWAQYSGGGQVYTPQVLANGRDWRNWPKLPDAGAAPSKPAPSVTLVRDGDTVTAQVAAMPGGTRWVAYWAVLEDGYVSAVKAGENAGETLHHDHVVRQLKTLPAWPAAQGLRTQLNVSPGAPQYPRRVVLVVSDAATQQPLQAVALGC